MASMSSNRVQFRQNSLVTEGRIAPCRSGVLRDEVTDHRDPDGVVVPGRFAGLALSPGLVRVDLRQDFQDPAPGVRIALVVGIENSIAVRLDDLAGQSGGSRPVEDRTSRPDLPRGGLIITADLELDRGLSGLMDLAVKAIVRRIDREPELAGGNPSSRKTPSGPVTAEVRGAGLPQLSTVAAATGRPSVSMTRPVIVCSGVTRIGLNVTAVHAADAIHSLPASVWFSGIAIARNRVPFSSASVIMIPARCVGRER